MKKRKSGILGKILITLIIVIALFVGGYFLLDKAIVPKYFGKYGINSVPDLAGVVTSLYKNPNESKLVTNGYTQTDYSNAVSKLKNANYNIDDDGKIKDKTTFKGDGRVELTDREFAAFCNELLEDGMLVDALPSLDYLNTMKISLLQVTITPNDESQTENGYSSANISFIIKLNTVDIRSQIAEQMQTPSYLLNMIIPDDLYFTVSYDFDLSKVESDRITQSTIAINGRTAKQSELLINLLIDFIFPKEDEMDIEKFTKSVGDIALKGIDAIGEFTFIKNVDGKKQNGILINASAGAEE